MAMIWLFAYLTDAITTRSANVDVRLILIGEDLTDASGGVLLGFNGMKPAQRLQPIRTLGIAMVCRPGRVRDRITVGREIVAQLAL
jgi:hypothetical protein